MHPHQSGYQPNNLFYLNFLKRKITPYICTAEYSNSKIVKDPNASLTKFNLDLTKKKDRKRPKSNNC